VYGGWWSGIRGKVEVDRIYESSSYTVLLMQILVWGNNLTGNLDPHSDEPIISSPRYVLEELEVEEISWSSWACTVGRGMSACVRVSADEIVGDCYYIWGSGGSERAPAKLTLSSKPVKFLGADEPSAYVDVEGYVHTLPDNDRTSSKAWRDVALTGLGTVYALSGRSLICY